MTTKVAIRELTTTSVLCAHEDPFLDITNVRYQIGRLSTNAALEHSQSRF
jgi:hypothetical protein